MKIDLKKGDEILTGKWKNKRVKVKSFGTDDKGQPTINGKPILKFRIKKLMPVKEMKQYVKLFEEFTNESNETYPKVYSDTHDPFHLYVKSPSEAYYIGFNPMSQGDETGHWPITHIDKIEGEKEVVGCIHNALNPPTDAEEEGFNPEPMELVTDQNYVKELGDKIEKWKHKFIKQ